VNGWCTKAITNAIFENDYPGHPSPVISLRTVGVRGLRGLQDKRGSILADLAPILSRIRAKPEAWIDTISRFGSKFHVAAGRHSSLKSFAKKIGVHWLSGLSAARASFS
jgi:hypothetical protein